MEKKKKKKKAMHMHTTRNPDRVSVFRERMHMHSMFPGLDVDR